MVTTFGSYATAPTRSGRFRPVERSSSVIGSPLLNPFDELEMLRPVCLEASCRFVSEQRQAEASLADELLEHVGRWCHHRRSLRIAEHALQTSSAAKSRATPSVMARETTAREASAARALMPSRSSMA